MVAADQFYSNSYGNVYGNLIATPICRIALAWLDKPSVKFQPPKYQAHFLFDKHNQDPQFLNSLELLKKASQDLIDFKYGGKAPGFKYPPIRDGAEKEYQGFASSWYIKASSKNQPEVVDAGKKRIDPGMIQNGMLVRAVITPLLFDNGVAYQLQKVQLVKDDGVRFYGGPDPLSLLDAIGGDEPVAEASEAPKNGKKLAVDVL